MVRPRFPVATLWVCLAFGLGASLTAGQENAPSPEAQDEAIDFSFLEDDREWGKWVEVPDRNTGRTDNMLPEYAEPDISWNDLVRAIANLRKYAPEDPCRIEDGLVHVRSDSELGETLHHLRDELLARHFESVSATVHLARRPLAEAPVALPVARYLDAAAVPALLAESGRQISLSTHGRPGRWMSASTVERQARKAVGIDWGSFE